MIDANHYKYLIGIVILITAFASWEFLVNYKGIIEGIGAFGFLGLSLVVNYGMITRSLWSWKVITALMVLLIVNMILIENDIRPRVLKVFIGVLEVASHFK